MRSLMRVSSVGIAASPRCVEPPTRKRRRTPGSPPSRRSEPEVWQRPDSECPQAPGRWRCTHYPRPRGERNPTSHRLSTWKDTSVSGLWTPGGGQPPPDRPPGDGDSGNEAAASIEEIEALRAVHAKLVATPVEDVIANHALGIWQLALVHLGVITPPDADGRPPEPNLAAAGLAID